MLAPEQLPQLTPEQEVPLTEPLVVVSEQEIVDAFTAAYMHTFDDTLTAANSYRNENYNRTYRPETSRIRHVGSVMLSSYLTTELTHSLVATIAVSAAGAFTLFRSIVKEHKTLDDALTTQYNLVQPLQNELSESLANLSCLLWKDTITEKLVIQIPNTQNKATEAAMIERLHLLESALAKSGKSYMLGGFIIPAENTAVDTNAEPTSLNSILQQTHPDVRLKQTSDKSHFFLESLLDAREKLQFSEDIRGLLEQIRAIDPKHPLLDELITNNNPVVCKKLAKQLVESRLSETIYRDPTTGQRQRSSALIIGTSIWQYVAGTPTVLPQSALAIPKEGLHRLSSENALLRLEYAIYRGLVAPIPTKQDNTYHEVTPIDTGGVISASIGDFGTVYVAEDTATSSRTYTKIRTFSEKMTPKVIAKKLIRSALLLGVAVSTLTYGQNISDNYDNDTTADVLLPGDTAFFTRISDELEPLDNIIPDVDASEIQELYPDIAEGLANLSQALDSITTQNKNLANGRFDEKTPNIPLWYITAQNNTQTAGYWSTERYDQLVLNSETQAYEWVSTGSEKRINNIIENDQFLDYLYPTNTDAQNGITVHANILPDRLYQNSSGDYFAAINIPIREGTYPNATHVSIKQQLSDGSMQTVADLQTALLHDSYATTIVFRVPVNYVEALSSKESAVSSKTFIDISYNLGIANPSFVGMPYTKRPMSLPSESDASTIQGALTYDDIKQLEYKTVPLSGEDVDDNDIYTLKDLYIETQESGTANCFTANTLLSVVGGNNLSPVSGFLLSAQNVQQDLTYTGTQTALFTRDSHMFTVDHNGTIFDATPADTDGDSGDFFEHAMFSPNKGGSAVVFQNSTNTSLKLHGENDQNIPISPLYSLGIPSVAALYLGTRFARKLSEKQSTAMIQKTDDTTVKAAALAVAAAYKLADRPNALLMASDIDSIASQPASLIQTLQTISPKQLKRLLKLDLQSQKSSKSPYTLKEAKQAVKLTKVANKVNKKRNTNNNSHALSH